MPNVPETISKEKAPEEPPTPAEGETTKGVIGMGKRQTFRYKSNIGAEEKTVTIKHDLGTQWVTVFAYSVSTGKIAVPRGTALGDVSNVAVGETELLLNGAVAPFKKGEESVFVFTA